MPEPGLLGRLMRWPVQRLVWPFVALVLALGWAALIARVDLERSDAERTAISRSQDRATLLEQHAQNTIEIAALTSLHLGDMYLMPGDRHGGPASGSPQRIDDPSIEIAGLSSVTVIDPGGRVLAVSDPAQARPGPAIIAELLRGAAGRPVLTVDGPFEVRGGTKFVFVTRRIVRQGETAGYVIVSLRPERFLNFPQRTHFHATDLVSVIGLDGITLARREGSRFSSGEDVSGGLVMKEQRRNPNGTYKGPSSLDGHVRHFSHRRLAQYPIFVTAGVSHSVALAQAHRRAALYIAVMGSLTILGLLIAWAIQREAAYRERNVAELAESTRRLQVAQRIGKIGDWEYDLLAGTIVWSRQLCEMYEREPDDNTLSFADFFAYLVPQDLEKFEANFQKLLASGGPETYEIKVLLPSGAISHRCINALATANARGEIVKLYGTDQDITQSHLVRDLEKQVAHLDRQGAMSMMAGTLAHELNQPLTAASNYITGAMRTATKAGDAIGSSVTAGLKHALDQIHGAAEIIRRVRRMVQVEGEVARVAPIREAITNALALLRASGFAGAEAVRLQAERDLPDAQIAPIQLQQVLVNLLKNALEAAPAGNPDVSVRARRQDDMFVHIEVCDNGPGFPDFTGDRFSAFQSDKEHGTGLGLSISRTIVEYHGGKLRIEKSEPGETIIAISLPAVAKDGETA